MNYKFSKLTSVLLTKQSLESSVQISVHVYFHNTLSFDSSFFLQILCVHEFGFARICVHLGELYMKHNPQMEKLKQKNSFP